jgi:hypothetical protein
MQASSVLVLEVCLTAWKVTQRLCPRKSALYHVSSKYTFADSGPMLSQDDVANSDLLVGAAEDAFYLIGSLCSILRHSAEPQKNVFYFLFFKILNGLTQLTWTFHQVIN